MSLPPQGPPPPYGPPPYGPPPPYGQQPPYGPQHPQWPPPSPYGQPWQWAQAGPPPKKSGTPKLLIAIVVIAVLAVAFMAYGVFSVASEGKVRTAHSASDFSTVCEGDSLSNAADYREPYNIAAFYEGLGIVDTAWLPVEDNEWARSDDYSAINVVACLERKLGSDVKSTTCEGDDGGDTVTIDYYSVEYEIEFREAKTGKVIKSGDTVSGTAGDCPFLASYDKNSRKMYATPDADAVAATLRDFAG